MPLREFADAMGQVWQAWDTHPSETAHLAKGESAFNRFVASTAQREGREPTRVRDQYAEGWLTFRLANARRRLAPIPKGWDGADDLTLRRYLDSAIDAPEAQWPRPIIPKGVEETDSGRPALDRKLPEISDQTRERKHGL
jgi:hypothetical protein